MRFIAIEEGEWRFLCGAIRGRVMVELDCREKLSP